MPGSDDFVVAEGLRKRFGGTMALDGLDLRITRLADEARVVWVEQLSPGAWRRSDEVSMLVPPRERQPKPARGHGERSAPGAAPRELER